MQKDKPKRTKKKKKTPPALEQQCFSRKRISKKGLGEREIKSLNGDKRMWTESLARSVLDSRKGVGFLNIPFGYFLSPSSLSLGVGLIVGFFFLPRSLRKIPRTALSGIFFFLSLRPVVVTQFSRTEKKILGNVRTCLEKWKTDRQIGREKILMSDLFCFLIGPFFSSPPLGSRKNEVCFSFAGFLVPFKPACFYNKKKVAAWFFPHYKHFKQYRGGDPIWLVDLNEVLPKKVGPPPPDIFEMKGWGGGAKQKRFNRWAKDAVSPPHPIHSSRPGPGFFVWFTDFPKFQTPLLGARGRLLCMLKI